MSKLNNKVAVVTGASKGIGAAIAKALANEGAAVAVNYASSREGADKVVEEIKAGGGKAIAVQGNVARQEDVARIFDETTKAFGRLDVLVNNAGVYEFATLDQITEEHYHRQFDTNVLGLLLATKEAVKHFGDHGGSVINISSVVTETAPPATAVYTGTKGAVDAITKALANELGAKKVRVNAINPGLVATEGAAGFSTGEFADSYKAQAPLGRIGQPNDIAPLAVFLASEDASWITGETVLVSGGVR